MRRRADVDCGCRSRTLDGGTLGLGDVVKRPGTVLVISWNSQLTVSIYCSRLAVENEGWCRLTFRSASFAPLRGIIRQKIHGSS